METGFVEVKKKLGFGCMRLPVGIGGVNRKEFSKMVDAFMEAGFNYFDTAHGYLLGWSETAIRECLVKRYPRESFVLTDKLTNNYFKTQEDIRPFFQKQLDACGVAYFDFYLMHAMTAGYYEKYEACHAFDVVKQLKEEGLIRHIGISFHDKPEVLEKMLEEHPEIEVVQIQFNYADCDNPGIESYRVYQVCEKFQKPVIVMEPVKGGGLVNLPVEGKKVLDELGGGSYASYAIRYCASFPQVFMVLSGMSNLKQTLDNISYMKNFVPFTEKEYQAVDKVREILRNQDVIPCTACRYCVEGCPKQIAIPDLFSCYNAKKQFKDWNSSVYYHTLTANGRRATDCIKCGKCEQACPQHLEIRDLLKKVGRTFH